MKNIIDKSRDYAIESHRSTNHRYNGDPYEIHLQMVYFTACKYQHLLRPDKRQSFLAAAWTHDLIEDCRQTYNDVFKATNKEVAELTYALTNEKGKNRKGRANGKFYKEIKQIEGAVLLKICDRIANMTYSIQEKSRMADMYKKEMADFIFNLDDGSCEEAVNELWKLCDLVK